MHDDLCACGRRAGTGVSVMVGGVFAIASQPTLHAFFYKEPVLPFHTPKHGIR